METILNKETSKDSWNSVKKKYKGYARARRQQLQDLYGEYEIIRLKFGESIT